MLLNVNHTVCFNRSESVLGFFWYFWYFLVFHVLLCRFKLRHVLTAVYLFVIKAKDNRIILTKIIIMFIVLLSEDKLGL